MYGMGLTANIMSLGGIAIAIGAMVDAAIVVVEQTHKKLEHWEAEGRQGDYRDVVVSAVKEVGGPSFFSLLVIAVSFMPVFTLEAQEGRLFKPLAFTKNFSMIIAAILAITLDPGHAAAVHPHAQLQLPAALAGAGRQRGAGRQDPQRGGAPHQPAVDAPVSPGGGILAAASLGGGDRRRAGGAGDDSRLPAARAPSSCRR